jgi:hypothetical protein
MKIKEFKDLPLELRNCFPGVPSFYFFEGFDNLVGFYERIESDLVARVFRRDSISINNSAIVSFQYSLNGKDFVAYSQGDIRSADKCFRRLSSGIVDEEVLR